MKAGAACGVVVAVAGLSGCSGPLPDNYADLSRTAVQLAEATLKAAGVERPVGIQNKVGVGP
jgi:hypothetical protein